MRIIVITTVHRNSLVCAKSSGCAQLFDRATETHMKPDRRFRVPIVGPHTKDS